MALLSFTIFLPTLGALLLALIPNRDGSRDGLIRQLAFGISLVAFGASIALWLGFEPGGAEFQFVERTMWIGVFNVEYYIGIDGIALMLIVLTGFLTPISLLASWNSVTKKVKEFSIFMLVLETAMIGVFSALDVFLFYVFWDAVLIPMYFLIGVWGYDRRIYASIKFLLFTMAGSVLMLIAIIFLAVLHQQQTGAYSFDILELYALDIPASQANLCFLAFALAFAIKVPLFPLHTWLPDAHVEAPTAGSVILAGVMLKMGTFGLMRYAFPLFPEAATAWAPFIATLAVIGIVYGALVAMVQPDMKKLVAYSSVSHLGFVVLGLCALTVNGVHGAAYQMLNHGISTGALFLIVGMLSERRHTRLIAEFGGLKSVMPKLVAVFLIITLSSIAMPGLNGFIGEFMILMGSWRSEVLLPRFTVVATSGVILSAVYMLWMFQRVNYGEVTNPKNAHLPDLSVREWCVLAPTVALTVVMGVFPNVFLHPMAPAVDRMLQRMDTRQAAISRVIPQADAPPAPGVQAR